MLRVKDVENGDLPQVLDLLLEDRDFILELGNGVVLVLGEIVEIALVKLVILKVPVPIEVLGC